MLLSTQPQLRLKLTSFTMKHQFSATTRHDSWRERPAYPVIPSSLGFITTREDVNYVQSNADGHWMPEKPICTQPATGRTRAEMLPNKSRDEKQRSEAAPKKSNEEESKSFELLQRALPGLDWPMLAHTHVHTGVKPMAKKKPSVGLCPT